MKLSLTEDEIKEVLIEWSRINFGGSFNEVKFDFSYSALQGATFWKEPPAEAEPPADLPCKAEPQ